MVRAFVRDRSPLEEVRRVSATEAGYDPGVWADLGGQLGLTGLLVPAEYGGAGCGLAEAGVVLQELGRGLASVPYLSSAVLAVTALLASGDEAAQADLLPGLATGDLIGAVAVSGPGGRADGTPDSPGVPRHTPPAARPWTARRSTWWTATRPASCWSPRGTRGARVALDGRCWPARISGSRRW
jgi:Acyl-CoA dehydrogenase, N-terminal domain